MLLSFIQSDASPRPRLRSSGETLVIGLDCTATFTDNQHLESLSPDALEQFMQHLAMAPAGERHKQVMTACPPHVRNT